MGKGLWISYHEEEYLASVLPNFQDLDFTVCSVLMILLFHPIPDLSPDSMA